MHHFQHRRCRKTRARCLHSQPIAIVLLQQLRPNTAKKSIAPRNASLMIFCPAAPISCTQAMSQEVLTLLQAPEWDVLASVWKPITSKRKTSNHVQIVNFLCSTKQITKTLDNQKRWSFITAFYFALQQRCKTANLSNWFALLGGLLDERLVDVRNHTTTSNGGLDEGIQLLITADGELKMARGDTLHLLTLKVSMCLLIIQKNVVWSIRTLRSFEALPASSSTSAVRYSRMAAE